MFSKLRKFGLEYCDLQTMVANSSTLLRALCLNLDPHHDKKIPKVFYVSTAILILSYFYVCIFSMIWFVFWKCVETRDIVSAMVILSLGISSEISTVKFVFTFLYQDSLRSMIGEYLIYDSKTASNSRFNINLLKTLKQVKKRALFFWVFIVVVSLFYTLEPILTPGRQLIEDVEYIYGLQPMLETPNYEISCLVTVIASVFTTYTTVNVSAMFITVTGYIEAQMLSLSEELHNIWKDAEDHYDENHNDTDIFGENFDYNRDLILNRYVKDQLRIIVEKHATNIDFLSKVEYVFRYSIAIEFGLLMVSLIAEFLAGIENTILLMLFALMQVTMDCYTGQKLLNSSEIFQRAVYECKWENFDVANRKTVLIILMNSQRDMALSVGGLKKLSFMCLMDVLRMIYSTYTALSSVVHH